MNDNPKPTPEVAARIEELLREQLAERGVSWTSLDPADIARFMVCAVDPAGGLTYAWKDEPILHARPEVQSSGNVIWRMFTQD